MKLAIFDVDGTLLDNLDSEDFCYATALREGLGLPRFDTDWCSYEHITDEGVAVEAYARAYGVAPRPEHVAQTVDRFLALLAEAHAREPFRPVSGASNLLRELPAHDWFPVLATGAWGRAARYKLAAAGLRVDALPLATAEDGPARVAIAQAAWARARAVHSTFDRVVLVGDGVWDVATARALALPFVGRATGARAHELRACGAAEVLADFADLDIVLSAFETAGVPLGAVS